MMQPCELEFRSICVSYGNDGRRELLGFRSPKSFRALSSQIYVLRGDNGSGKSSFLKALVSAVPIATGTVVVRSVAMELEVPPRRLASSIRIAYLPQQVFTMFPTRTTVYKAIEAWGRVGGRYVTTSKRDVLIHDLGLSEIIEAIQWQYCQHISGGEAQQLGILLCALVDPTLVLLDEPTASISREARAEVVRLIQRLARRSRFLLVASHDECVESISHATIDFESVC